MAFVPVSINDFIADQVRFGSGGGFNAERWGGFAPEADEPTDVEFDDEEMRRRQWQDNWSDIPEGLLNDPQEPRGGFSSTLPEGLRAIPGIGVLAGIANQLIRGQNARYSNEQRKLLGLEDLRKVTIAERLGFGDDPRPANYEEGFRQIEDAQIDRFRAIKPDETMESQQRFNYGTRDQPRFVTPEYENWKGDKFGGETINLAGTSRQAARAQLGGVTQRASKGGTFQNLGGTSLEDRIAQNLIGQKQYAEQQAPLRQAQAQAQQAQAQAQGQAQWQWQAQQAQAQQAQAQQAQAQQDFNNLDFDFDTGDFGLGADVGYGAPSDFNFDVDAYSS
jgi:hypothetical protein